MKNNKFFLTIVCLFFHTAWAISPYDAARKGQLEVLRQYRFEGNDLFIPDERGFIPYELAALHADPEKPDSLRKHVETMLWLKEYQAKKHRYGKASIAFVQASLNALGYHAGRADGWLGKHSAEAIKNYQKDNHIAQTGRLGPQWLGLLYKDSLKDLQYKLTKLGFDTQGCDGLMGEKTRRAIFKYRHNKHLSKPDYPHLDALLIDSVSQGFYTQEKAKKAKIAKQIQEREEKQAFYIQSSLRALGYRVGKVDGEIGSKTLHAIKAFQQKKGLKITGELDEKTLAVLQHAVTKTIQRQLNALGYQAGRADGKMGKKTQGAIQQFCKAKRLTNHGMDSHLIQKIDDSYRQRKTQHQSSSHQGKRATNIKTTIRKPSRSSQTKTRKVTKLPTTSNRKVSKVGGHSARGKMTFNRKNSHVIGCQIAGRRIPIEWCEPFYPLPKKNHCEATFKPNSNTVINLWCK